MRKNDTVRVRITDINNLGCGVGHLENAGNDTGMTVFVRGGVTGDELEAKVIKATKSYLVARPERILVPSPHRTEEDLCTAALGCGGCAYRHVTYSHELELKRGYVQNAFKKVGLDRVEVEAVRHTDAVVGYRNKAQYPVQKDKNGKTVAGFYANSSHRIVPAEECRLQPKVFGEIVRYLCDFADKHRISAYNEETGKGLLRHIYLRIGVATGEIMLCLVLTSERLPEEETLKRELAEKFPAIKSLWINVNSKNTNVVLGERYRLLSGNEWIEDVLCGLTLRITPQSFYQVNHDACELLYGLAKERAALTGEELLLDLYCGIGSIGLSMADRAGEVLGMEIVERAAKSGDENAARNGITNAAFFCGDASDPQGLLKRAAEERGELSRAVVVIDPPRKGTTRELIEGLAHHGIRRVVYVSCNPDTLARDCAIFSELGYEIGAVTPVDLFPRTGHVESVVCLMRK
ncbi:MAG: 23S rRNA (uracil(1939)-C(5))-methyltransferase RlmD [Ruminococcaceae bacterium]|nr:23S rRNA (uracil(1939)-C(5))-methyltransferase RlmD [Oscillospiraceae bacterium]